MINTLISRSKVGYLRNSQAVYVRTKKIYTQILYMLWLQGFINGFCISSKIYIRVFLKYKSHDLKFRITKLYCLSKPGNRVYTNTRLLRKKKEYYSGFYVTPGSRGLLTSIESILFNTGGELLLYIS